MKRCFLVTLGLLCLELGYVRLVQADDSLQFKVKRTLSIQKMTGHVFKLRENREETAIVGDPLQAVGDGIRTGPRSTATLVLDTHVGIIEVSPEAVLRIQQMQPSPKGGYIIRLSLSQGQLKVKLKSMVHSDSQFEIQTPSSVSGVRGTVFGVAVQPTGDTSVATESGKVSIVAKNHILDLSQGENALVPLGEAPVRQTRLSVQPTLSLTWLSPIEMASPLETQVRIAGSTSPLNLLQIADRPFSVGQDGQFDCVLPLPTNRRISILVITPLGSQRYYELVVS